LKVRVLGVQSSARRTGQRIGKDSPVRERVTTELFGISLAVVFVSLLILNAISF
jgi:hypothetical protein